MTHTPKITKQTQAVERKMKPSFTVDVSEIPEAKDWDIGKTYKVEMTVRQMRIGMDMYEEDSKQEVSFQIEKIKAV